MRYSLVIFDCDGVLVDSEILSAEATSESLRELGVLVATEIVMRDYVGMTQSGMEAAIEQQYRIKLPPDFEARSTARLMQVYRDRLQPIEGVRELIGRLPVPSCVASNSAPGKLGMGLCLTGLFEALYPHIYCAKLVARGKPAPDLFLYAADKLGVRAHEAVVVEDSVAGITAAKAAGMTAIGFIGGLHNGPPSAGTLRAAGADHIAETMPEVSRILGL